jgi:hypothetical protein
MLMFAGRAAGDWSHNDESDQSRYPQSLVGQVISEHKARSKRS